MVFAVLTFSTFGTSNSQNVYLPLEVEFLSPVDLWRISFCSQWLWRQIILYRNVICNIAETYLTSKVQNWLYLVIISSIVLLNLKAI